MSKHLLLTGGLGFIGAHVVEHVLETTNWYVTVLDSMRFAGRVERLTDIDNYDPSRCQVLWHDLRSPIHNTLRGSIGDIDWIVNMASDSHVDRSITDPVPFVHNNVMLALNALEYAREVGPEKFIQISTDEVYGPAPAGESHVETDPLKPSNPYAASKAAQEQIAYSYWRTYDVPVMVTRTMNNLGERQNPEKFVPMVIKKVLNNENVTVHAYQDEGGAWHPGSRVWLHARNHGDAIRFLLDEMDIPRYGEGEMPIFNVAGEEEIDNLAMAQFIAQTLNRDLQYTFVDFHSSRPGHDLRYSLDGGKLREAGWEAPVPLRESLVKTVRWYEQNQRWLAE